MQQNVSVVENPRLCELQGQLVLNTLEHGLSFSDDNGIHHDLIFIDQSLMGQLGNDAAASQDSQVVSGILFHPPYFRQHIVLHEPRIIPIDLIEGPGEDDLREVIHPFGHKGNETV